MNPAIYFKSGGNLQVMPYCIPSSEVALIVNAVVFM